MKPATKSILFTVAQLLLAAAGAWLANKANQQNVPIDPTGDNHVEKG